MPSEPSWISPAELITPNRVVVEATGEPHFVRDAALLDSAAAVPENRWAYGGEDDLVAFAAALLFAVARNQQFEQGNKRTGFVAMDVMLQAKGLRYDGEDIVELADAVVAVIAHEADEPQSAERLRTHVRPAG